MRGIVLGDVVGHLWIIVVLIFVGLIWWKLDSLLQKNEICVLQSGFTCLDKRLVMENGELKVYLKVKNNLGRWVEITGIICSSETPDPALGKPQRDFEKVRVNVLADSEFGIAGTCHLSSGDDDGKAFRGLVYIQYEYRDGEYTPGGQVIVGNVQGSVR